MAAMLEEQNNKSYLHKNKTFFPMERNSIVFRLQRQAAANTLYRITLNVGLSSGTGAHCPSFVCETL